MVVAGGCPWCGSACLLPVELAVDREIAWAHPHGPIFPFACPACGRLIDVRFDWRLERGAAPRRLRVVGGAAPAPRRACILLVAPCPHGCGERLGLQVTPTLPFAPAAGEDPPPGADIRAGQAAIAGGFRCVRCDGEGRLRMAPLIARRSEPAPA